MTESNRTVAIFGAGAFGRIACQYLRGKGLFVECFFDNDKSKQGIVIDGLEVRAPDLIDSNTPRVVIAARAEESIKTQLKALGCENYTYIGIFGIEDAYREWQRTGAMQDNIPPRVQSRKHQRRRSWKLPTWLISSRESWCEQLKAIYEHHFSYPASLSPEAGELYRSLILNTAPARIVEIGIHMGASTLWAGSALRDLGGEGRIDAADIFLYDDIFGNQQQFVQERIDLAGLNGRIELHKINTNLNPEALLGPPDTPPIDFLFIDGDHTPRGTLCDFLNFSPRVAPGGYILLHDIFPGHCGWEGPAFVLDTQIRNRVSFEICAINTFPNN